MGHVDKFSPVQYCYSAPRVAVVLKDHLPQIRIGIAREDYLVVDPGKAKMNPGEIH
jgi:hypothetical protein